MAIAKQQIKPMETALADTPRDCDAGPSMIYLWGMPVGFCTKAVFIKQAFLKNLPDGVPYCGSIFEKRESLVKSQSIVNES
jgi:hypothetical protein